MIRIISKTIKICLFIIFMLSLFSAPVLACSGYSGEFNDKQRAFNWSGGKYYCIEKGTDFFCREWNETYTNTKIVDISKRTTWTCGGEIAIEPEVAYAVHENMAPSTIQDIIWGAENSEASSYGKYHNEVFGSSTNTIKQEPKQLQTHITTMVEDRENYIVGPFKINYLGNTEINRGLQDIEVKDQDGNLINNYTIVDSNGNIIDGMPESEEEFYIKFPYEENEKATKISANALFKYEYYYGTGCKLIGTTTTVTTTKTRTRKWSVLLERYQYTSWNTSTSTKKEHGQNLLEPKASSGMLEYEIEITSDITTGGEVKYEKYITKLNSKDINKGTTKVKAEDGDIVTYEIKIINESNTTKTVKVTDIFPHFLKYVEDENGDVSWNDEGKESVAIDSKQKYSTNIVLEPQEEKIVHITFEVQNIEDDKEELKIYYKSLIDTYYSGDRNTAVMDEDDFEAKIAEIVNLFGINLNKSKSKAYEKIDNGTIDYYLIVNCVNDIDVADTEIKNECIIKVERDSIPGDDDDTTPGDDDDTTPGDDDDDDDTTIDKKPRRFNI